jgi:hypothetical protein
MSSRQNAWARENRVKVNASVRRRMRERRDLIQRIKSERGCIDCGETHPAALDFHHRDGERKVHVVSKMCAQFSLVRLMEEIDKCDVMCCNCHRKLHHSGRKSQRNGVSP